MENQIINPRRRVLNNVIANLLVENSFDNCEKEVFETLTEMLQSCK